LAYLKKGKSKPNEKSGVVIYLTLESFLEGKNGRVDGILELHVVIVSLLQEGLAVDVVFAHGCCPPCEVGTRWIALEQPVENS